MAYRRIIRRGELTLKLGVSEPTTFRIERNPAENFPQKVRISPNAVGWFEDEIDAWMEARRVSMSAQG